MADGDSPFAQVASPVCARCAKSAKPVVSAADIVEIVQTGWVPKK